MRAVSFVAAERNSYGVVRDDGVYEAHTAFRRQHVDLRAVLRADKLANLANNVEDVPLAEPIRYLPPVPNASKILCVGVNYRPHAEEMGRALPEHPLLFARFRDSVVGHGEPLLAPRVSPQYDYEGEVAVVIGRPARCVAAADAAHVIAGYSAFMDGTVRDWQRHTSQFLPGKNFTASGAFGPWLVTADELAPGAPVTLETRVSGETMQRGDTTELIFDIPALIEYCSTFTELAPGDVIVTGTPSGVGAAREPPRWLEAGDVVEVDLGSLGCLRNPVCAS